VTTGEAGVRWSRLAELTPVELYALLRLRVDVFVVEQACAYPDLDGRDAEPDAWHAWIEGDDGGPVATLRVLREPDGTHRIGRVVTAPAARGRGLAGALVRDALARVDGTVVLHAQSHLAGWYAGFGFVPDGPDYVEDGIPHTPMRLRR
jgi:ElaA protein